MKPVISNQNESFTCQNHNLSQKFVYEKLQLNMYK